MADQPLSHLEQEMAVEVARNGGLELMSFVDGPISSSSRAELVGLIISLFSSLPVHAAIDSQVVLETASNILVFLSSFSDLSEFRAQLPQSVEDIPRLPPPPVGVLTEQRLMAGLMEDVSHAWYPRRQIQENEGPRLGLQK